MGSRAYLNIFLIILTVVLALVLTLDSNQDGPAVPDRLTNIDPESIQSISIIRQGRDDIHLTKSSQQWHITRPIRAKASQFRVNSILSLLQSPVISQLPSNAQALVSYGLDVPDISLRLNDKEFQFGSLSALDKRRYLKHDGAVYLIEDFLYPQLRQDAGFFISTRLFDGPLKSIHITCINGVGDILEWNGSGEIIMAWESLNAVSVSTAAPPMQGLANIRTETGQNGPITLTLYMNAGDLILKPSQHELYYRIPDNYAGELGIPQSGCIVQDA